MTEQILSIRCINVLRRTGKGMTGTAIAKTLDERPQAIVHMMSRLCTLKIVMKRKEGDHFRYFIGPAEIPSDLGAVINGRDKLAMIDGGAKIIRGQMTVGQMLSAIPPPRLPIELAWERVRTVLGSEICVDHVSQ